MVISSSDPVCPVGYINFTKLKLKSKPSNGTVPTPRTSLDFVRSLIDSDEESSAFLTPDEEALDEADNDNSEINLQNQSDQVNNEFTKDVDEELRRSDDHNEKLVAAKNAPSVVENCRGWLWVAGLQSAEASPSAAIRELLQQLQEIIECRHFSLRDLVRITLYIGDMAQYLELNAAYVSLLDFQNPPTRICVELVMPPGCTLIVEAVAHRYPANSGSMGDFSEKRNTLHVQSISHWAPANIGPYSQSIKVRETCIFPPLNF